jgi:riboflavin kinase/FMN adenylyltransferase
MNGLTAEAHLLNFDTDLYGQTLALDFIARLRDERPFSTLNALVSQIQEDIQQARRILKM